MDDLKIIITVVLFFGCFVSAVFTLSMVFSLYGQREDKKGLSGASILNTWWLIIPYFPHELPDNEETRRKVRIARLADLTAWMLGGTIYLIRLV
jgi:hypothetical protein